MDNPTILLVESNESLRQKLEAHLLPRGLEIIQAPDKVKLRQYCKEMLPDLAVIGSNIQKASDGLKEIRQIRQWDRKIPIIVITKYSSEDRIISALREGINDYSSFAPLQRRICTQGLQECINIRGTLLLNFKKIKYFRKRNVEKSTKKIPKPLSISYYSRFVSDSLE